MPELSLEDRVAVALAQRGRRPIAELAHAAAHVSVPDPSDAEYVATLEDLVASTSGDL